MSTGLKREDELKLKDVRQRVEDNGGKEEGTLDENESMYLSWLEDRYAVFLDEGLKKLRQATPSSPKGSNAPGRRISKLLSKVALSPRGGPKRENSDSATPSVLSDTASTDGDVSHSDPNSPNDVAGTTRTRHWSFLSHRIIVGAIPFAGPPQDPTGHLVQLQQQCASRNSNVGIVVACIDPDEEIYEGFAGPKEWEHYMGVSRFLYFPLPKDPATKIDVPFDEMLSLCAQIHEVISDPSDSQNGATNGDVLSNNNSFTSGSGTPMSVSPQRGTSGLSRMFQRVPRLERKRAAYIHCKAGRQRSWVVSMCYLISQRDLSYSRAESVVSEARECVCPSEAQIEYVKDFEEYFNTPAEPVVREISPDEQRYLEVLADVLSLPQEFRSRLVKDLEKLA